MVMCKISVTKFCSEAIQSEMEALVNADVSKKLQVNSLCKAVGKRLLCDKEVYRVSRAAHVQIYFQQK